jgi:hypothetical protein
MDPLIFHNFQGKKLNLYKCCLLQKSHRETRDLPYQPEAIIQRLRKLLRHGFSFGEAT